MNFAQNINQNRCACPKCRGLGKRKQKVKKSVKILYQKALEEFNQSKQKKEKPIRPKGSYRVCSHCNGTGLVSSNHIPNPDVQYPNVGIVGGGIGGMALAVALYHRGIPFTLYERDASFNARSQGYGLTLQQASKAIKGFGITDLTNGIVSTRHVVHTPDGEIVGEWGMRKWLQENQNKTNKRTNIHIARQSLRKELMNQLNIKNSIFWNHQFFSFKELPNHQIKLKFDVNGEIISKEHDLVVGADGIRSVVRNQLLQNKTPLRYLGCIVILGICELKDLHGIESDLLDSETVFQTANGNERIYMMPYDKNAVMWQLSFSLSENEAKQLSSFGANALKEEAIKRLNWHSPIPEILKATPTSLISGYPVYDRALLKSEFLQSAQNVTILGDAAHPMSPFKGQGANQALLDALSLARRIFKYCGPNSNWREKGLRNLVLNDFEEEMIERSTPKVKDSAEAADFLHSEIAIYKANQPRGKCLKSGRDRTK